MSSVQQFFSASARDSGASVNEVAEIVGIDPSNVSRHYDDASFELASNSKLRYAKQVVDIKCVETVKITQA